VTDAPRFTAPEVIAAAHDASAFDSGEAVLDVWLRERAPDNLALGASRTYVARRAGTAAIAGYYALAMGGIVAQEVPGALRRNMPRVIPCVVLGRLAVDRACQGRGLGALLLRDAVERALRASGEVSARLVLVHALTPAAEAFHLRHGFARLPGEAPTLALDLVKYAATRS
jgi:GNAT superfamily N-acetyltransferase